MKIILAYFNLSTQISREQSPFFQFLLPPLIKTEYHENPNIALNIFKLQGALVLSFHLKIVAKLNSFPHPRSLGQLTLKRIYS